MLTLMKSDFLHRFAGGFVLGVIALVGMQPDAVKTNLGLNAAEVAQKA